MVPAKILLRLALTITKAIITKLQRARVLKKTTTIVVLKAKALWIA